MEAKKLELNQILTIEEALNKTVNNLKKEATEIANKKINNLIGLSKKGNVEELYKAVSKYTTFTNHPVYQRDSNVIEDITSLYNKHLDQKPFVSLGSGKVYFSATLVQALDKFDFLNDKVDLGYNMSRGFLVIDFDAQDPNYSFELKRSGAEITGNGSTGFVKQSEEILEKHKGYVDKNGTKRYGVFMDYKRKRIILPILSHRLK